MPLLGQAAEAFLNLVWSNKTALLSLEGSALRKQLYNLYNGAGGNAVQPAISEQRYQEVIQSLQKMMKGLVHESGAYTGSNKPYFPGSAVTNRAHGFYEFHGGPLNDTSTSDGAWRVYVNAQAKHVAILGRMLLDVLARGLAFYFKFADDAAGFEARTDGCVIYTDSRANARRIAALLASVSDAFFAPTAHLTEKVCNGVGIGQEPVQGYLSGNQLSFGQHRILPYAMALNNYREFLPYVTEGGLDDAEAKNVFRALLVGAFKAFKINWLNPGENDPRMQLEENLTDRISEPVPQMDWKAAMYLLRQYATRRQRMLASVRETILRKNLEDATLL